MIKQNSLFKQVLIILMLTASTIIIGGSVQLSHAAGFWPEPGAQWHDWFCTGDEVCAVGNFDGQGGDDIIAFVRDARSGDRKGDVYVATSNGTGFQPSPGQKWHGWFCLGNEVCAVGNFDGQGGDDIVAFVRSAKTGDGEGDVYVALSDGASFQPSPGQKWHGWFCTGSQKCLAGDFNGDGKDDIIAFVRDSDPARQGDVYVATSNGASFQPSPGQKWHDWFCTGSEVCAVGDVDGDGKDDIITFVRDSKPSRRGDVYVALSSGTRFLPNPGQKWHDLFCLGSEVCAVDDVNGDGRADLVAFSRDARAGHGRGDVHVALSTGSGFGPSTIWHDWFCLGGQTCALGDFNADGKNDLAAFVRSTDEDRKGDVYVALAEYPSQPETSDRADAFGYGGMTINGVKAIGERPLLVVLMQASGGRGVRPFRYGPAYYDRLIFGPAHPNVADYYQEVSYGQFTWQRAALLGPLVDPDPASTLTDRQALVKQLAFNAGFDFATYDANGDGKVTGEELGILMIDNYSSTSGQTSAFPGCVRPTGSSVDVCSGVAAVGEGTSLTLVAHELSHLLGSEDIYGSTGLSNGLSLLSLSRGLDDVTSFHPDPWHKMRLGWIEPRIYRLTDPGSCTYLEAPQNGGAYRTENRRPIILYDPNQGTNTYFIMEYRTPDTPSGGQYDANVASQGLALWYVQTNNNKNLVQLPSLTVPGKTDGANFSIGAPDYSRGGTQLWQHIDGILNPSWVNGVDTGLNIQAGPVLANTPIMEVEWGYGKPFTAYIAKLVGAQSGNSGSLITLDGLFGVANGGRVVSLTNGVDTYDLEIESWSCTRISVRVPVGVPAGSYKLRVYTDASHATGSNAVLYTVEGNNTITIPPGGSSFTIPDDGSAFTFPAGVFSETVIFHHTPVPSNTGSIPPFGDMIGMDRFFTVEANYVTSGRPAQPIQSYSVHIPYNEGQLDGVDESTLALYYWDEDRDQWIRESTGSVDTANNVLVANPNHFSLWAILGEAPGKHLIYLPFVQK